MRKEQQLCILVHQHEIKTIWIAKAIYFTALVPMLYVSARKTGIYTGEILIENKYQNRCNKKVHSNARSG